jgi:hypothetical protein
MMEENSKLHHKNFKHHSRLALEFVQALVIAIVMLCVIMLKNISITSCRTL